MSEHEDAAHGRKIQRRLIIGTLAISAICILGVLIAVRPQWYQNYAPPQPIPFSHARHAGQFNIPCLYCHSSAEYAAHSEVPGLETCMNCHSVVKTDSPWIQEVKKHYDEKKPLAWVKVHVLPDFVRFNHKPHIAAGVQCQTCHGPVEKMERVYQWAPLTMGWCIDCHRNNDYLTPRRIAWGAKEVELGGVAGASTIPRWGKTEVPEWYKQLAHKHPHNADVSCSTCHY